MKCFQCDEAANFICPCQKILLCDTHLGQHLRITGQHPYEVLNVTVGILESEIIKNLAYNRIKLLQQSKIKIFAVIKQSIKKLESCSKAVVKQIDDHIRSHLRLVNLKSFSNSLKTEIDKMKISTLVIKELNLDIDKVIEKTFDQNFITIKENEESKKYDEETKKLEEESKKYDKEKHEEANLKRKKEAEEKKILKIQELAQIKEILLDKVKEYKLSLPINYRELSLTKKKENIEFLNLGFLELISEIKFSSYGEYAFICKIYAGKLI